VNSFFTQIICLSLGIVCAQGVGYYDNKTVLHDSLLFYEARDLVNYPQITELPEEGTLCSKTAKMLDTT
jgi:hypothetical protein